MGNWTWLQRLPLEPMWKLSTPTTNISFNSSHTPSIVKPVVLIEKTLSDLSITKTDTPDPVFVTHPLTYTSSVSNLRPTDASDVVVTLNKPSLILKPQTPWR